MDSTFYVYMWLREEDDANGKKGSPYYVGQGGGRRAFSPHRAKRPQSPENIVTIATGLTRKDAQQLEMY